MTAPTLESLAGEIFVSLSTFRKTGEAVATPVWIVRDPDGDGDGDALAVLTTASTGKVKRLRNSPRIQLRASNRSGKVDLALEPVEARAEIREDPAELERLTPAFVKKYGIRYRIIMPIQKLMSRGSTRIVLHITSAE